MKKSLLGNKIMGEIRFKRTKTIENKLFRKLITREVFIESVFKRTKSNHNEI